MKLRLLIINWRPTVCASEQSSPGETKNMYNLTKNHPCSHYGIPVLTKGNAVFGPSDHLPGHPPETKTAADYVVLMWSLGDYLGVTQADAAAFCAQWPDGPQCKAEGRA
jgi:hypothetical protein